MRLQSVVLGAAGAWLCATPGILAFDQLDVQIFTLRQQFQDFLRKFPEAIPTSITYTGESTDEVIEKISFYDWLELPTGLSDSELQKQLKPLMRKIGRTWHPDRNDSKVAIAGFPIISNVISSLQEPGFKHRYDTYLATRFPEWRPESGWSYTRYRPGLFGVLAFLLCVLAACQYVLTLVATIRRRQRFTDLAAEGARQETRTPKMVRRAMQQTILQEQWRQPAENAHLDADVKLLFPNPTIYDVFLIRLPCRIFEMISKNTIIPQKAIPTPQAPETHTSEKVSSTKKPPKKVRQRQV